VDIISEEVHTEHKEEQIPEKRIHRRAGQLRALLKTLITFSPLIFFGGALLVNLPYWATGNALWARMSIVLVVLGVLTTMVVVFTLPS